jgi:hypothetical protein
MMRLRRRHCADATGHVSPKNPCLGTVNVTPYPHARLPPGTASQLPTHAGSKLLGHVFRQRTPLNNPRQGDGNYYQADGEDVQRTHMSAEK